MGGIKRKLPMEKIEKKSSRAVCFSKRRPGLYRKASEFFLMSGAQMAILMTPPSSESLVSFYSWGHSSVDSVVDSFLKGQRPVREDNIVVGCDPWWEEESLAKSENAEELSGAIDSFSRMLSGLKKRNLVLHETQKVDDQTLDNLQSSFGILDDTEMVVFGDQVMAISETTDIRNLDDDGYGDQELDLDQLIITDTEMVVLEEDAISETTDKKPTRNLDDGYGNQELGLDQLIDSGSLLDDEGFGNLEMDIDQLLSLLDDDFETTQEQTETNLLMENPSMCSGSEDEAFGLYRGDDFGHDNFEASLLMNSSEVDNDVSFHDDLEASVLMISSEMDNDVSFGRGLYEDDDLSIFNELSNICPL